MQSPTSVVNHFVDHVEIKALRRRSSEIGCIADCLLKHHALILFVRHDPTSTSFLSTSAQLLYISLQANCTITRTLNSVV